MLANAPAGHAGSGLGCCSIERLPARSGIGESRLSLGEREGDAMRICIFGKYPPIQGGVSTRTYWLAQGLAKLGHAVHVVTNAKEATLPYRMFMRDEDWARCNGRYGEGSVTVHWTECDKREWHIPSGTPYVTKLASLGLELARAQGIDLIYSYYVEP